MKKHDGARTRKSNSRKRKLGETKPNFNEMVKAACKKWETPSKKNIGETKPNSEVPTFKIKLKEIKKETVKSGHELELEKYQETRKLEREAQAKKLREDQNKVKFVSVEPIRKDPNRGMRFVSCSEPINRGRLGHSKTFLRETKKIRSYYW